MRSGGSYQLEGRRCDSLLMWRGAGGGLSSVELAVLWEPVTLEGAATRWRENRGRGWTWDCSRLAGSTASTRFYVSVLLLIVHTVRSHDLRGTQSREQDTMMQPSASLPPTMTSLSLTPAPAPAPGSTTLLTTLKSFLTAQQTRHSLSSELEAALSTYLLASSSLPAPPSPLPSGQLPDILSAPSTCASEAIRPPNEAELGECLRIGFVGLMDIKTEMDVLVSVLRDVWNREDLAKVVERVEEGEVERLKEVSLYSTRLER
jgi:hypothetical protein